MALCERIGREEGADMQILRLAALLHDIGRAEERHSFMVAFFERWENELRGFS
jgi:putative nucleotidyltransferase with HDIG domain